MDLNRISTKIIHLTFFLLFLITPLIFIPGHTELFQFNKMTVVYLATCIIIPAWVIRMLVLKRLIIKKTPFDLPLLLFLASQTLSTIFSIEPHTSLWGYYSRFHGGLFSIISYLLLFYAFLSNQDTKLKNSSSSAPHSSLLKTSLLSLTISTTTVAFYGILEHFGIDEHYWIQDVRNRVFSTTGQPNWLAALLVCTAPVFFFSLISQKRKNRFLNLPLFGFALFYLTLLYTKSRSGFLGFSLMFICFWSLTYLQTSVKNRLFPTFCKLTAVIIFISVLVGTPYSSGLNQIISRIKLTNQKPAIESNAQTAIIPAGGTESSEIRKIVWKGALAVSKNWPLWGSGVETFAYSYYRFRPIEHNYVSEWDFLYNKAHNEYLNFLATTGIFGLMSYLFLQFSYLFWSLKNIKKHKQNLPTAVFLTALLSGYLGLSLVNFFGFSTVTDGLLFFLYPAFAYIKTQESEQPTVNNNQPTTTLSPGQIILILLTLVLFSFPFTAICKRWYADRLFTSGKNLSKANNLSQGLLLEQKASQLVPDEPIFHDHLSLDLARSAVALYSEQSSKSAALLADSALAHSDRVMQLNPVHINFLKNRTAVLLHLAVLDPKYRQLALDTLLKAQTLSPTDPKIPYNLALFYLQQAESDTALIYFLKSIELKSDYVEVRVHLAEHYQQLGQPDKAIEQYLYILEKIDSQNPTALNALQGLSKD